MKQYACKKRYVFFRAVLCCMLLQLCLPAISFGADNASVFFRNTGAFNGMAPDFTVEDSFSSHLPVLVLEENGDDSSTAGTSVRLTIYSGSRDGGSFLARPKTSLDMLMKKESSREASRLEGAGSEVMGKSTYSLELSDSSSALHQVPLAGLPAGNKWRLQGSTRDKGMLRNGVAYALGRVLFPGRTPETRYCEVLFKKNGGYHYEGLYILAQSEEQLFRSTPGDRNMTLLLEYDPGMDKARPDNGQIDEDEVVLGLSLRDKGFTVVLPDDAGGAKLNSMAEMRIDAVESVLRSLKPDTYLQYTSLVDQNSAIDFYILNTLMLNAHEAPLPLYLIKAGNEAFSFAPIWNFDAAIDNVPIRRRPLPFEVEPLKLTPPPVLERRLPVWRQLENGGDIRNLRHYPVYRILDADNFLWFDRLFLSRPFLMDLFSRYHELRRGPLSPDRVTAIVDEVAATLGPALARDWKRWERDYTASEGLYSLEPYRDSESEVHIRQTFSYDQELVKIRHSLLGQDAFLIRQISQLNWISADLFDQATRGNRQGAYAFATIIAFLFLTYMLTRKL